MHLEWHTFEHGGSYAPDPSRERKRPVQDTGTITDAFDYRDLDGSVLARLPA